MSLKETDGTADRIVTPWANPKLTVGEAMDIQIKEARQRVQNLCVQKAKLEAMDWLSLHYHEVTNLLRPHDPF